MRFRGRKEQRWRLICQEISHVRRSAGILRAVPRAVTPKPAAAMGAGTVLKAAGRCSGPREWPLRDPGAHEGAPRGFLGQITVEHPHGRRYIAVVGGGAGGLAG